MKRDRVRSLSIAIVGTRGVPPRYGGFETFAGELSTRLVARGHRVAVYCRRSLYPNEAEWWNGVRRIELPAVPHKYLETVSHALLSSIDALGRDYDAVLVCNAANAFILPLLASRRLPVAINVDGIERMRRKWNVLGRVVYQTGESFSALFANRIVSDAAVIDRYYREHYAVETTVIPYGSDFPEEADTAVLGRLGVEAGRYVLYVSRFEPENNPLEVVRAYRRVRAQLPLVMIGDAPYAPQLREAVRAEADSRVILPGAIYGADYRTLQRNAALYVQATEVGGTHPAMIEAMASNGAVVANDTPENREVGGDAVAYFRFDPEETLSERIDALLADRDSLEAMRMAARGRARRLYSWKSVVDTYERLFFSLAE